MSNSSKLNPNVIKFSIGTEAGAPKIPVPYFTGNPKEDLRIWNKEFDHAADTCGWSEEVKFQMFKILVKDQAKDLIQRCTSLSSALSLLKERFYSEKRYDDHYKQFKNIKMHETEPASQFEFRLRELADSLEYCGSRPTDREVLHAFLEGLHPRIQHRVYDQAPIDIEDALILAQRMENHPSQVPSRKWENRRTTSQKPEPKGDNSNSSANSTKGRPKCTNCKRMGHTVDRCFRLHPELRPPRAANAVHLPTLAVPRKGPKCLLKATINGHQVTALIDTGADVSLINPLVVQKLQLPPVPLESTIPLLAFDTTGSNLTHGVKVTLGIEGNPSKEFVALIPVVLQHDLLLGVDFLQREKALVNFDAQTVEILGLVLPLFPERPQNISVCQLTLDDADIALASKASTDPPSMADIDLKHLPDDRQQELLPLVQPLVHQPDIGLFKGMTHRIDLQPSVRPFASAPYRIPYVHLPALKAEVAKLLNIGVLRPSTSAFASPAFVIPKRTGEVRLVGDFRKLNSLTVPKRFPLPRIEDLLLSFHGMKFFTTLDLNSGYHQISIDPDHVDRTAIILPFGLYEYVRMPFGLAYAPMTFQAAMQRLFMHLDFVRVYLDDILIASRTWQEHVQHVAQVLAILKENGLTLNLKKCLFAKTSVEYLGFEIDENGIQPSARSVTALQQLTTMKVRNRKHVRSIVGSLNFLRMVIPNFSSKLAPLTSLTQDKIPFHWTEVEQSIVRDLVTEFQQNAKLYHVVLGEPFELYTDASDDAIGAVLLQFQRPVYFFSKKFDKAQKNYTVSEKEALAIVWTLHHLRQVLLGSPVTVYTDHSNLLFLTTAKLQRIQRWKLLLDEYDLTIVHVPGSKNSMADVLSRSVAAVSMLPAFPLDFSLLADAQEADVANRPANLITSTIANQTLFVHPDSKAIWIPPSAQKEVLQWSHTMFFHPGSVKLYETLKKLVFWPSLLHDVTALTNSCTTCATAKPSQTKYGLVSRGMIPKEPFQQLHIDLLGPFSFADDVLDRHGVTPEDLEYSYLLTMIDAGSRWIELVPVNSTKVADVIAALDDQWLSRYPRPETVTCDNGPPFNSEELKDFLSGFGIQLSHTTTYNPQSNSFVERLHGQINNMIRTQQDPLWYANVQGMAWAYRSSFHRVLGCSPAEIVFSKNMLFTHLPIDRNQLITTAQSRQSTQQQRDLQRINKRRVPHTYAVNDLIYTSVIEPNKTQPRWSGPYKVVAIHEDSTLSFINDDLDTPSTQRINLRRVKPFLGSRNVA
jgi:hypothetical protein